MSVGSIVYYSARHLKHRVLVVVCSQSGGDRRFADLARLRKWASQLIAHLCPHSSVIGKSEK